MLVAHSIWLHFYHQIMNSDFNGHFLVDLRDFSLGSVASFALSLTL